MDRLPPLRSPLRPRRPLAAWWRRWWRARPVAVQTPEPADLGACLGLELSLQAEAEPLTARRMR